MSARHELAEGKMSLLLSTIKYLAIGTACLSIGFVLGRVYEEDQERYGRYLTERSALVSVLQDPRFARVEISRRSVGGAALSGFVDSDEAAADLRRAAALAIGESRLLVNLIVEKQR